MRYHGLDALRAFAMMMGVVLHASMFYVEGIGQELGYELTGRRLIPTSDFLGLLFFFIHVWRMPLFFLLAGFFARLIVQKRGFSGLLKNRLVRIVIPLIAGVLVYSLVFKFGELNELHHMWFLRDLVLMYILLAVMKYLSRLAPGIVRRIDEIFSSTGRLWLLTIFLLPATTIGRPGFFNWIETNLDQGPGPFFLLGFLFVLIGWFMHRNTHILDSLSRVWRMHALIGLVTYGVFVTIMVAVLSDNFDEDSAGGLWILGMLIQPVVTFLLVMAFIGGTQAIFQRSNKVVSYFVDSSYWVYLLHLFVVFFIGGEIIKTTNPNPLVGAGVNIFATTLICMVTYHVLVRYTPIGWVLHGKKGPFSRLFKPFSREDVSAENGRT